MEQVCDHLKTLLIEDISAQKLIVEASTLYLSIGIINHVVSVEWFGNN